MTSQFFPKEPHGKNKYKFSAPSKPGYFGTRPSFSFRHFDDEHKKFSAKAVKTLEEWRLFFKHLKGMCGITWGEIVAAGHKFHAHEVPASKACFKHLSLELQSVPAFQFKAFAEFRVIGYFNAANVFEIVWLDRDHEIYPDKKR